MTVKQAFEKMLSNLNLTPIQRTSIQTARATIDQTLKNDPKIHLVSSQQPSFLTGSYSRNTIIRPVDDIDLYVKVHYGHHAKEKNPRGVLILMRRALGKRYPQTKINVDSPCVVIKFMGFKFEIVPAVGYSDDDQMYMVPGAGCRSWVHCYPHVPNTWLTNLNHYNNEKFVPLIKILKQWNRFNKVGLKSFHLELLTGMVFNSVSEIDNYPQGVFDWFHFVSDWIHNNNSQFILEPGKTYLYVDQYLYDNNFRLRVVRKKLKIALRRARDAYFSWVDGKELKAKRLWRQMFGEMFPAPLPLTTTNSRLVPPKKATLPRLVPPKFPTLAPPTSPPQNFLAVGLRDKPENTLATLLGKPEPPTFSQHFLGMALSDKPKNFLNSLLEKPRPKVSSSDTNALLGLLRNPRKKYPWGE